MYYVQYKNILGSMVGNKKWFTSRIAANRYAKRINGANMWNKIMGLNLGAKYIVRKSNK